MPTMNAQASDIVQNPWFERLARCGHIVSGVLHLLIGYIAIRIALGKGGSADQSGAFRELTSKTGGTLVMWVVMVAFLALAVWRLVEGAVGKRSESKEVSAMDRIKAFSLAILYFAFAWSAFTFAKGAGKSSSEQNAGLTARAMESGIGKLAIVVVAGVFIGVGGYHCYKGISKKFLKDLKSPGTVEETLGTIGYTAKGLALIGIGVLFIAALFTEDPGKATGLDGALKTLREQAFGTILLVVAGFGIAVYGLYSFVMAKSAKM